jgi:predicted TIM-barrel fold metal-dependent hydrolase
VGVLIDAHCHSVVAGDVDRDAFERWCTEADAPPPAGVSYVDSQVGSAVRRWCPPVLDLPAHTPVEEYLARRAAIGWREATVRLMRAAGLGALLVDTGLDGLLDLAGFGALAGAPVHEVVRLERVAEDVASSVDASRFASAYVEALAGRVAGAVAVKSVIAYRYGLDIPPERPSTVEVRRAADGWLRSGGGRLTDPVLLRYLLWTGVDTGLPLQLHTGFGDRDLPLRAADPALAQPFLAAVRVPVVLLHCYPYHRNAGWLALVYPHVYADVGLTLTHVGARAGAVLGEFCELVPFGKLLFSTDAYGLPELYVAGVQQFRHALAGLLDAWVRDDALSTVDAERVAAAIGGGNAAQLYGRACGRRGWSSGDGMGTIR